VAVGGPPCVSDKGMGFRGAVYLVKCGRYQDSEFGQHYFGHCGRPMNPTVALWPGRRKMQMFSHP